jgi:hypothetical protein
LHHQHKKPNRQMHAHNSAERRDMAAHGLALSGLLEVEVTRTYRAQRSIYLGTGRRANRQIVHIANIAELVGPAGLVGLAAQRTSQVKAVSRIHIPGRSSVS